MFGNFLLKSMLKKQMKGVPEEQQEFFLNLIEKNPDFLMKIANEAQEKIKGGMPQQDAMMVVMDKYKDELKSLVGNK